MTDARSLTPESLLRHEPFVRAVLRGILRDEAETQDVLQETWLRALRRPPHDAGALRPWLARVARRVAFDARRGGERRRTRERASAKDEAIESVDAARAQLSAQREVVDAVLALREPYRSVVLMRYFQELDTGAIAVRLDRSPATVRSQLSRAHELLRVALDARFEGGRAAWSAVLVPWLREGAAGSSGAGVASAAALVIGAVAVTGAVLLLRPDPPAVPPLEARTAQGLEAHVQDPSAGDGAPAQSRAVRPVEGEARTSALDAPGTEDGAGIATGLAHDSGPSISKADDEQGAAPSVSRARLWFDGVPQGEQSFSLTHAVDRPAASGSVTEQASGDTSMAIQYGLSKRRRERSLHSDQVMTDEAGYLEYNCPEPPGTWRGHTLELLRRVTADGSPVRATIELPTEPWSGVHDLGNVLLRADLLAAEGVVLGPDGRPKGRVRVELIQDEESAERRKPGRALKALDSGWTDREGRFRLFHDAPPERLLRVRTDELPGPSVRSEAFPAGRRGLVLRLPRSTGVTVSGRVLVGQEPRSGGLTVFLEQERFARGLLLDEAGCFETAGWMPGAVRLRVQQVPRRSPHTPGSPGSGAPTAPARPPALHEIELEIPGGVATVELPTLDLRGLIVPTELRCVDEHGQPVVGAFARPLEAVASPASLAFLVQRARNAPSGENFEGHGWWPLGETGRAELLLTTSRSLTFDVVAPGFRPRRVELRPGRETVVLEPTIDVEVSAPIAVGLTSRLAGVFGREVGGEWSIEVELQPVPGSGYRGPGPSAWPLDAEGRLTLHAETEGEHELTLYLVQRAENHTRYAWLRRDGEPALHLDLRPGPPRTIELERGRPELIAALRSLVKMGAALPPIPDGE